MGNRRYALGDETGADAFSGCIATIRVGFTPVIIFSFFINILMLTLPLYMLQVFDRVLGSGNIDTLFVLTALAIISLLTLAALEGVRTYVMIGLSGWMSRKLGGNILGSSVRSALGHTNDPSVRGLRDLETLRGFLTGPSVFAVLDAPWVPVFLAVIFFVHPLLGWIATVGALFLFFLALANEIVTREPLGQASSESQRSMHRAETAVRNADMISAMGVLPNLVQRWNQDNGRMIAFQSLASRRGGMLTAIAKFARFVIQLGVLGAGAYLAVQQEITPGSMIASSIIMGRALAPVEQAIGAWKGMVAARVAYAGLKELISSGQSGASTMELPPPEGKLTVSGLTFGVPARTEPILSNVSFSLEPGEALGLIGPSAAGKTTLARLLVGSWLPSTGHVRLDGADMSLWRDQDRLQYMGYLPQDVELLGGTVKENIARMGEAEDAQVIAAAKLADVHEMILSLPEGYDTQIGEAGGVLSGGQRQRIALARALFGTPKLLVLDEPNANLDRLGEQALLDTIDEIRGRGVTIVVIAHRPSMLEHVDKILVLREGKVDMYGTRDDVMARLMGKEPQAESSQERVTAEREAKEKLQDPADGGAS
jgi:PrtD family type I secretion system ABC transporter